MAKDGNPLATESEKHEVFVMDKFLKGK